MVHLSDTASDVTVVLEALCLRMCVYYHALYYLRVNDHFASYLGIVTGKPLPINVIAAFLRLGKKYEIELLHADALKRLHYEYPSTLEDLDQCNRYSMIDENYSTGTTIVIANLAREQGLLRILPLAFYRCCQLYTAKWLAAGFRYPLATLSSDDALVCFIGWTSLASLQSVTTLAWIDSPTSTYMNCTSPVSCARVRKMTLRAIFFTFASFVGDYTWSKLNDYRFEHGLDEMCRFCESIAKAIHNAGRAKFWEALPSIFDMPDWADLREE